MFNDSQLTKFEHELAEERGDLQKNIDEERKLRSDHDTAKRKLDDELERDLRELERENAKSNNKINELEREIAQRRQELQKIHDESQKDK